MIPPPDPIDEFRRHLAAAEAAGSPLPVAASLATADARGTPSVRMVLLRGLDGRGFVFYTHRESRKGRELAARPQAALCFWWAALEQQVRVEGAVEEVAAEEADAYFASRPRGHQIGAWASQQSEPLDSLETLAAAAADAEQRFAGAPVPRPPYWTGYRVIPSRMEFWYGRENRLHERILYRREAGRGAGGWRVERLYP